VNYSIDEKGYYIIRDPQNYVRTRNFILTLDSDFNVIDKGTEVISKPPPYPHNIVGLEDIRTFGSNEFFCTCLEVNEKHVPQMCYGKYNDQGEVTSLQPLQIGDEIKCEKNWVPFIQNNIIHFIYTFQPLRIYKIEDDQIKLLKEADLHLGDFRGSSSPIPYNNGWLCTVHQVYYDSPRKYFHRFIWFNQDFTTAKYTPVFYFQNTTIEYNLSICTIPTHIILPFSIKDNCTKIGLITHEYLEELFLDSHPSSN
jgi:hypothetical protein